MVSQSDKLMAMHPLQRFSSPSRSTSAIVHFLGIISFSLSFKYLVDFPTFINSSYGWHWQYLTILGLTVAFATFVVGFIADVTLSPTLFLVKNGLALCSAPLEVLISILYYSIRSIDKDLIIPPGVNIAPWADVGFHLMPALLLTVDLLFLSPPWTIHAVPAMGLSLSIAMGYWAWSEQCYKQNGFYPYPLFGKLDTVQRIILFGGAALLMTASTVMLKWLHGRVNGLQGAQHRSTPRNIKGE